MKKNYNMRQIIQYAYYGFHILVVYSIISEGKNTDFTFQFILSEAYIISIIKGVFSNFYYNYFDLSSLSYEKYELKQYNFVNYLFVNTHVIIFRQKYSKILVF